MQTRHHVVWSIDIYADTPVEAAKRAFEAMQAVDTTANYFEVFNEDGVQTNVDLSIQEPSNVTSIN